jgi:hypothetical protein
MATTKAPKATAPKIPVAKPLTPDQQTASAIIRAQLAAWGIPSLSADASSLIRQGYGTDAVLLQLQETPAYKTRFIGNEDRRRAGLPVLAPGDYVDLERQYRNVMRSYGLPAGFFDTNDDLRQFIARDVSPVELQQRAQDAQQVWLSKDADIKTAWRNFYGLSDGDAIAAILNPKESLSVLQRKVAAAQIGGRALANNQHVGVARAEQLADLGVTAGQAAQGYGDIGQAIETDKAIAARFGQTLDLADEENARILGLASAQRKLRDVQSQEKGLFEGRAAASNATLSRSSRGAY